MSWAPPDGSPERRGHGQPVTSQYLEERINMYISAMDKATSMNDDSSSTQLQRDIQHLVDLMEKVTSGQAVMETDVPPPIVMTPIQDAVANPLGELSSRLSDYHKALYFAEEELSDGRLAKIQVLQKGLQTIHSLQKRAQAGFPIKEDEIPPPVSIPDDSEFDNDALKTITTRLEQYKSALTVAANSIGTDRRRIPKLESRIRTLEFLLTRAKAKRPVWRRDIPPEFDYYCETSEVKAKSMNVAKLTLQARALLVRISKLHLTDPDLQVAKENINEGLEKLIEKWTDAKSISSMDSASLTTFTSMLESLEKNAELDTQMKEGFSSKGQQDLALIDARIREYRTAALKAKREGDVNQAIKNLKVVKGLQPMRMAVDRGEKVDMTLVPPPPRDTTPSGESAPPFAAVVSSTEASSEVVPLSAHAQVTPFNVTPTTETAEDKLARKLTSFLEDEGEMKSFTSASSSSSLESDWSPLHRPDSIGEKIREIEAEKEIIPSIKELLSTSNTDTSGLNEVSSDVDNGTQLPEQESEESGVVLSTSVVNVNQTNLVDSAAMMTVPSDSSTYLQGVINKGSDLLSTETVTGMLKIDGENVSAENIINENLKNDGGNIQSSVRVVKEKDLKSENERSKNDQTDEDKPVLNEKSGTNIDEVKKDTSIDSKRRSSKNPLDAIGFLACQDVQNSIGEGRNPASSNSNVVHNFSSLSHSSLGPQVELTHSANSSQLEDGAVDVQRGTECQQQNLVKNTPCDNQHMTNVLKADDVEINPAASLSSDIKPNVMTLASTISNMNETVGNKDISTLNSSVSVTSQGKENVLLLQDPHGDLSSSDSSTDLSKPCFVNSENEMITQKSIKDELAFASLPQAAMPETLHPSDNLTLQNGTGLPSEGKVDVRSFYNLSCDDKGFEDSSDLQEFQELMDSMSLPVENTNSSLDRISLLSDGNTVHSQNSDNAHASGLTHDYRMPADSFTDKLPHASQCSGPDHQYNSMAADRHSSSMTAGTNALKVPNTLCADSTKTSTIQKLCSELTGLETLKYDMLLAAGKNTVEDKKEAEQLKEQMAKIKEHLRRGGRREWEEYKVCLERELHALNDGVKKCGEIQEWDMYKYLNNKRMLNERELSYLNQRIGEIKD